MADFIFLGYKMTEDGDCSREIKRCLLLGRKAMKNLDSILKSRGITYRQRSSQSYNFSSSHIWMWTIKQAECQRTDAFKLCVLEKTTDSLLDCKEIKPAHPKGNQSWIFIGRTGAESEAPFLRPPDAKNWLTGKDPDARKDWRQEEKRKTEDEIVGQTLIWANSRR